MVRKIILIIVVTTQSLYSQSFKVIDEIFPPFVIKEGSGISGFSVELLRAVLENAEMEISGEILIYPWARALVEFPSYDNSVITTLSRTEERENCYQWVGPICERNMWIFRISERADIKIEYLEDLSKYTIGLLQDSGISEQLISTGFVTKIYNLTSQDQCIQMLLAGRVDLIFMTEIELNWRLKILGLSSHRDQFKELYLYSNEPMYYFAFNKSINRDTIEKIRHSLIELKEDGRYSSLRRKYFFD